MSTKTKKSEWSKSDKRYGWQFGCDGFINATEASVVLDLTAGYVCELLRELETAGTKSPTDRTWPLRAGRRDETLCARHGSPWRICKRSVEEYAKRRAPVEV